MYCFETALKIWESDVKQGPPFHTFLQLFYKKFKILVLRYNLSHFVPIFQKIDEKLGPDVRDLLFLCNEEFHKKFAPILIVW